MLHAAHAAMHLWSAIGTARHFASAQLLLGQVHALLGNAGYALPYAQAAHDYFMATSSEPLQLAISHAILANAAHCAGKYGLFETNYATAIALSAKLPNVQDKAVFEATMNVVPKPKGNVSYEAV
jgi:hypothetical protein